MDWGRVEYKELGNDDYKATAWNKVQMKQFGNDDYKKIDWGRVEYKEVLKIVDSEQDPLNQVLFYTAAETGATAGVPGPNAPAGAPVAHIASGILFAVYWASTAACVKAVTA